MAERRVPRRLSFYRRLSVEQKREYDRSDARTTLPLAPSPELAQTTNALVELLASESPARVAKAAQRLVDEVCRSLASRSRLRRVPPPPRVKVLRTRPRSAQSEFHGLYTRYENGESEIRVWMFTAAHRHVVKPRTFLRTLLHEVCHHVDMTFLDLPSSLHTLGFHARESSLVRALERSGATIPGARGQSGTARPAKSEKPPKSRAASSDRTPKPLPKPPPKPVQLELFAQPSERSLRQRPS